MNINADFLTKNTFSRPGRLLLNVKGIVIHWVGNANSTARGNRNYFENLKRQQGNANCRYASAHYIIGLDGEIIQCIPDDEMAYHVGSLVYTEQALKRLSAYPNNCTIGIELCHPEKKEALKNPALWVGKFNEATLSSCRELMQSLLKKHGLFPENVWRHFDITGKDCPRYFVRNENAWREFIASIG
jgi:N-acetylmuramoyl-L-alanine amidase